MKFKPIASYKSGCKECLKIASQKGQPFRKTEIGDRNSWYENGAYEKEINHLISHPQLNPTVFGVLLNSFSFLVYDYYNNGNGNLVSVEPVEEECGSCLGEGEQECWSCNGEGEDWEGDECDECNGSGMVDCEPCYGMGEQDGGYEVTGIDSFRYKNYIQPIYDLTNRSSAGRKVRDAMYRLEAALEKGVLNDGHNKERKPLFSPQKDKFYTDLGDAIGFYIINEPNALTGGNNYLNYMAEDFNAEMILRKESCCCGATVESPCLCMFKGVMKCSANKPMCPCYKEIAMGTKVEMEHTKSKERAEKIAKEHLAEHPDYYSRLKKAGLAEELKGHMSFAESFDAEYDFQNHAITTVEADNEDDAWDNFGMYGIEEDWAIVDVRDAESFEAPDFINFHDRNNNPEIIERVNHEQVEYWLGSDNPLEEAIDTLTDIANEEYKVSTFRKEVLENSDILNSESFEADWFAVKCVECEKPGYSDEMNMYNGMYLCARCANPHLDFSRYDAEAETFYEVMGIKPMAKGGKRWVIENELGIPIGDFDSITAGKKAAIEDYAKKSKKTEGMMFWPPAFFGKGSHRKSNKGYTVHRNAAEGILTPTSSKSILAIALIAGFLYGRRQ